MEFFWAWPVRKIGPQKEGRQRQKRGGSPLFRFVFRQKDFTFPNFPTRFPSFSVLLLERPLFLAVSLDICISF